MSKFKNIPGLVWLVIGVLVTLLVIPSTAYAAALRFTGIEGTSTNKADVTSAGQLLTAGAQPANLFGGSTPNSGELSVVGNQGAPVAIIAAGSTDVILDALTLDVGSDSASSGPGTYYELYIGNTSCASEVGHWVLFINPTGIGATEVPLTPGVAIPAGDFLCGQGAAGSGNNASFALDVSATGSLLPAGSVSNAQPHARPALNH